MLRTAFIFALAVGFLSLTAFRAEKPKFGECPFTVNTTESRFFLAGQRLDPAVSGNMVSDFDSTVQLRVMMVNYTAYDSAYANKVHRIIQQQLPACMVVDFWEGAVEEFQQALTNIDVAVFAYPSGGQSEVLKGYGKVLSQFVKNGGGVIFTGTHEFSVLQQLGLIDLDFGYFCAAPQVHAINGEHPILSGYGTERALRNYAYPLDISDPGFVTLADVRGYPVIGYKNMALGKVAYLGLEYYYEEPESARFLSNTLRWMSPGKRTSVSSLNGALDLSGLSKSVTRRTEEQLRAGTGLGEAAFNVNIYPNPYISKATVDVDISRPTVLNVEVTDETGRIVAVLLPVKSLNAGLYRLELPSSLLPGVYFVQFNTGERTVVKKVVKMVGN